MRLIIGPVTLLAATSLAREWIVASAQTSYKSSGFLPSTPQYLLAVGNLGMPGFSSLWKSLRYYFRRRTIVSPVLTHSTLSLAVLISTAVMVMIGDIWIHASSSSVSRQEVLTTSNLHNFSRAFAPPENSTDAPWRLQQGLQTFLGVNAISTVTKVGNTTVIVPADIPPNQVVVGSTIGLQLTCNFINPDCIFNTTQGTFDCTSVQPGADGPLDSINVTLYSGNNSTNFKIIAAMSLPSLFNSSTTIVATQVFQCFGSLQNVTYEGVNSGFDIITSSPINYSPLTSFWDLDEFQGKRDLVETALTSVGTSTIYVQGADVTTTPSIFADGLARLTMSFLTGQTIPTQSLMVLANEIVV
jgi:hypothetical protein